MDLIQETRVPKRAVHFSGCSPCPAYERCQRLVVWAQPYRGLCGYSRLRKEPCTHLDLFC